MKKNQIKQYIEAGVNVNVYQLPCMKEHLVEFDDKQKEVTGMPLTKHWAAVGGTGSGKSQTLVNFIQRTCIDGKPSFDKVYLCCKTPEEPLYAFLKQQLKSNMIVLDDILSPELPRCKDFPLADKKKPKHTLLVFDDCAGDDCKSNVKAKLDDYFKFGRKRLITCCFISQSYFDIGRFVRKQLSFVLLNGINSKRDFDAICREYAFDTDVFTKAVMSNMYDYVKHKNPIGFMRITCARCPNDKKVSCDWTEYLNPNDFREGIKRGETKTTNAATTDADENKEEDDSESDEDAGENGVHYTLADLLKK